MDANKQKALDAALAQIGEGGRDVGEPRRPVRRGCASTACTTSPG